MEGVGGAVGVEGVESFRVWGCGKGVGDEMGSFSSFYLGARERDVKWKRGRVRGKEFFGKTVGNFRRERKPEILEQLSHKVSIQ